MGHLSMIIFGSLLALLFVARGISALAGRRAEITSPGGIVHELSGPEHRHSVRFGAGRYTWNPALAPGSDNRVAGPGIAHYSVDHEGTVHLVFVPDQGDVQRWSGPLPATGAAPSPSRRPAQLAVQPAVSAVGFVLGDVLSSGATDHHLAVGFVVGIGGWIASGVTVMATNSVIGNQAFAATRAAQQQLDRSTPPPEIAQPAPADHPPADQEQAEQLDPQQPG